MTASIYSASAGSSAQIADAFTAIGDVDLNDEILVVQRHDQVHFVVVTRP